MYSTKSYKLTAAEFNYLLPVLRSKMLTRGDDHYFAGSSEDLEDMLNRLKGLYDHYDNLNSMTVYKCTIECSLLPFRTELGVITA